MHQELIDRISRCERENKRLRKRVAHQNLFLLLLAAVVITGSAIAAHTPGHGVFDKITAHEVTIVDGNGVVRARLGGNLPNAVINGKMIKRGSKAAGLLIYDEQGIERGGYVTQDRGSHAMLTLDAKGRQTALFAAGPTGGTVLKIWNTGNSIALRSSKQDSHLTIVNNGQVEFQKPTIQMLSKEACSAYREFAVKRSVANAVKLCHLRFTGKACNACLGRFGK